MGFDLDQDALNGFQSPRSFDEGFKSQWPLMNKAVIDAYSRAIRDLVQSLSDISILVKKNEAIGMLAATLENDELLQSVIAQDE